MTPQLPAELRALVSRTVSASRLRGAKRQRVARELEAHFADGLESGVAARVLARDFGDPDVAASLIRYEATRTRRLIAKLFLTPIVAAGMLYGAAVVRVRSAPDLPAATKLATQADFALAEAERGRSGLTDAGGIREGFQVAAMLRTRRDFWSEMASLTLLRNVVEMADSLLSPSKREWLADSLRALAVREGGQLAVRGSAVAGTRDMLIASIYGSDGRVGPMGRRLIVRTKGQRVLGPRALMAEPLYFALPLARTSVQGLVDDILEEQLESAHDVAQALDRLRVASCQGEPAIHCRF